MKPFLLYLICSLALFTLGLYLLTSGYLFYLWLAYCGACVVTTEVIVTMVSKLLKWGNG